MASIEKTCDECDGDGFINGTLCDLCDGMGWYNINEEDIEEEESDDEVLS